MDYQELEAFMRLPAEERERRTVQMIYDVREGVDKLLSSESCPFASCAIKPVVEKVVDDVEDLKEAREEGKENRRTWRDYAFQLSLILLGSALAIGTTILVGG